MRSKLYKAANNLLKYSMEYSKLKSDDELVVYHGTSLSHLHEMINGFDANEVKSRHYGGPRHKGLFVSPNEDLADRFSNRGEVIIKLQVPAKYLHGTDWSGNIGREDDPHGRQRAESAIELAYRKFPESFRPYLSDTLSQKSEPQALLRGLIAPSKIKAIRYKPYGKEAQWFSREEFLNLGLEAIPAKDQPYGKKQKIEELDYNVSYPGYSKEKVIELLSRRFGVSKDKVIKQIELTKKKPEGKFLEYLLNKAFGETAAKKYEQLLLTASDILVIARKFLKAAAGDLNFGYKVVKYDDNAEEAKSLMDGDFIYQLEPGSVIKSKQGVYLGTSKKFVLDYYSGLTDDQELLLTFEYNPRDLIKGNPDEDGEIKVQRAKLYDVEKLNADELNLKAASADLTIIEDSGKRYRLNNDIVEYLNPIAGWRPVRNYEIKENIRNKILGIESKSKTDLYSKDDLESEYKDYRMQHQPAWGPAGHEIGQTDDFPRDILQKPEWYTGYPNELKEFWSKIKRGIGMPDKKVIIYRALPKSAGSTINTGNWITLSKTYAEQHAEGEKDWHIVEFEVPLRHIRWAGDDLMEWGYWGPKLSKG
jgi:hypothetical protein